MHSTKLLPFSLPEIGEEEIGEVCDALRSGWITSGPKTRQFENDFAAYLGSDVEAIAVNSATAGLHLALEAIGIQPGDEVITTTLTFTATAEVIRYLGADPVLVDVDPRTLNIDVGAFRRAITPRTRAVMPVHYAGLPCEMDEIIAVAREYGIRVIEDAAHAFPARYKGRLIGTLNTDVSVFSFYANKTMTTGEGGMIVTRNPALIERMKIMRLHGISRDVFDRFNSRSPAWYYEVVAPGFKYNLTDIASAVGIHQLRKIDSFLERRRNLAKRYFDYLADLPLILPSVCSDAEGTDHAWHLYVIRLNSMVNLSRDDVIKELSRRGIGTSVHYVPLHRQPYWRDRYKLSEGEYPVADEAYQSMISLPLYTKMTDGDQDRVITALKDILK